MSADPVILDHIRNLKKLCRLCGQAALTYNDKRKQLRAHPCLEYARAIQQYMGVDVTKDKVYMHPPCFCHRCRVKLYRPPKHFTPKVMTWYEHDAFESDSCPHCEKVAYISKGGRPVKRKPPGRPTSQVKQEDNGQEENDETTAKPEGDPLHALLENMDGCRDHGITTKYRFRYSKPVTRQSTRNQLSVLEDHAYALPQP